MAEENRQTDTSLQTLLVLGDSLSAGFQMGAEQAWPNLLDDSLQPDGWQVINASISGDTTDNGLRRLPDLLERHNPSAVLIELGANDGLRGMMPDRIERNLVAMIEMVREAGADPVLTQIELPRNYGKRYTQAFAAIFPKLAKQQQVPLMPFFVESLYLQDGMIMEDQLHPTEAAQPLIKEEVEAFLRPLLM